MTYSKPSTFRQVTKLLANGDVVRYYASTVSVHSLTGYAVPANVHYLYHYRKDVYVTSEKYHISVNGYVSMSAR